MNNFLIHKETRDFTMLLLHESKTQITLLADAYRRLLGECENKKDELRAYESDMHTKVESIVSRLTNHKTTLSELPLEAHQANDTSVKHQIDIAMQSGKLYGMLETAYKFRTGQSVSINNEAAFIQVSEMLSNFNKENNRIG